MALAGLTSPDRWSVTLVCRRDPRRDRRIDRLPGQPLQTAILGLLDEPGGPSPLARTARAPGHCLNASAWRSIRGTGQLSQARRALVAIALAQGEFEHAGESVLILDEPTATLTAHGVDVLFRSFRNCQPRVRRASRSRTDSPRCWR